MSLPRCGCGFVMPGPMHGRDCRLYNPEKTYATPLDEVVCSVDDCEAMAEIGGMCRAHHEQSNLPVDSTPTKGNE